MTHRLEGKVALITGIGGGMGRTAAQIFAREGAKIVGCDIAGEGADETVRLVREAGGEIENFAPVDLSDPDGARRWVESAIAVHGHADILYNNASTPRFGPVEQLSIDDWRFVMDNELNLVFYTTKAIWGHFRERGAGVILNVGSIAGSRGAWFMEQNAHGTAKGGVISLTRQLAAEGGPLGIRAVSLSPGFIATPSTAWLVADPPPPLLDTFNRTPLGRPGVPKDVVNAAVFLASDEAEWITGIDLVVDGGVSAIA